MTTPLSNEALYHALNELAGWHGNPSALTRTYKFGSFAAAIAFMQACVSQIDADNHHPEWTNIYNRVIVRLTTHDAGDRVSEKDVQLARLLDRFARDHRASEPTSMFLRQLPPPSPTAPPSAGQGSG